MGLTGSALVLFVLKDCQFCQLTVRFPEVIKLPPMVDMLFFDTESQPRRKTDGKGLPYDETTQESE